MYTCKQAKNKKERMTTVSSKLSISDEIFVDNDAVQREQYVCPICSYLLKDAVQTSCGDRFCQDCVEALFKKSARAICPRKDCGEILKSENGVKYFPDKFVRKEIGMFQVRCLYHAQGCLWSEALQELTEHTANCSYVLQECEYCHEKFAKSKLNNHIRNCPDALVLCPFAQYGCEVTKEMTRAECDEHLKAEAASHLLTVASLLKKLDPSKQFDYVKQSSSLALESIGSVPPISSVRGKPVAAPSQTVQSDSASNQAGAASVELLVESPLNKSELEVLKRELATKESQIRHLQDKLQQVEATVLAKTTENEDRDFRLSLMENSNYDGTMVWKIPQFTPRMEDARTGKYTSIFSLPFYSGRYGYKMCLRLYILGDGAGKGSHMSLFFVLMKGEFDNILQWPFTHKVTFKLINQCGGRDVVDVFQPDPLSSSFQKPKTDMNIASGCPRFVSLTELMQNGFIVDDTIFIKVKVNLATVKHP